MLNNIFIKKRNVTSSTQRVMIDLAQPLLTSDVSGGNSLFLGSPKNNKQGMSETYTSPSRSASNDSDDSKETHVSLNLIENRITGEYSFNYSQEMMTVWISKLPLVVRVLSEDDYNYFTHETETFGLLSKKLAEINEATNQEKLSLLRNWRRYLIKQLDNKRDFEMIRSLIGLDLKKGESELIKFNQILEVIVRKYNLISAAPQQIHENDAIESEGYAATL